MIEKHFNKAVLSILLVIFVQGFFKGTEGISPEEEVYRLKIHDLNQEKTELLNNIHHLENNLKSFEHEILENDSIIDNSSHDQLDSLFLDYFNR